MRAGTFAQLGVTPRASREQIEACTALNFTPWQRLRHVLLPQAFVVMLPTFGNNGLVDFRQGITNGFPTGNISLSSPPNV